jgi:hypothetical protein
MTKNRARLIVATSVAIWLTFFATAAFVSYYPSCQEPYGAERADDPAICNGFLFD